MIEWQNYLLKMKIYQFLKSGHHSISNDINISSEYVLYPSLGNLITDVAAACQE
jgi:hypothetical protein